jgi:hypothetical protein
MVLLAVGVAGQALPPVLDPADGVAEAPGQEAGDHLLRQQDVLVAEAAAHVGRHDAHGLLMQAEAAGQAGADNVRHLRAAVQHELAHAPVPVRDQAAALDGRRVLPGSAERAADGDGRAVAGLGRAEVHPGFQERVVAPMRVKLRRARLAPGQHTS